MKILHPAFSYYALLRLNSPNRPKQNERPPLSNFRLPIGK